MASKPQIPGPMATYPLPSALSVPRFVHEPDDWVGATPSKALRPAPSVFATVTSTLDYAISTAEEMARTTSLRTTGLLIAFFSIVFSAPDATLLRCLQQDGTSNSTILVWKMLCYSVLQASFGVHQDGSVSRVLRKTASAWPWMLVGSLCMSIEWLATLANLTTSSASALCLFYIAPLWAVPMGMLFNSDALHWRTLFAMAVALAGICLIFAPNVLSAYHATPARHHTTAVSSPMRRGQHRNTSSLSGDVCGLVSGLAFAAWITTCRHASLHKPDAPLALCGAIGTLAVVLPAALMARRGGDDLLDVSPRFIVLVLLDCAAIAAYNVGTMVASKYLPSAELGLYLTLDVVFGPLLVWGVHGEVPTNAVMQGGGLLVGALVAHEIVALVSRAASSSLPSSPKLKTSEENLSALIADESSQPLNKWRESEDDSRC